MPNDDAVISFSTRKKLSEEKAEQVVLEQKYEDFKSATISDHQAAMLEELVKVSKLITEGRLTGLILIAQESEKGFMMECSMLNLPLITPPTLYAYVGKLTEIGTGLVDMASTGPHMSSSGHFYSLDPIPEDDEE